jgi:hypothetical protein
MKGVGAMADLVRQAREDLLRRGLLGGEPSRDLVPNVVMRSWRRSMVSSVDRSAIVDRFDEVDTGTILFRAAGPVLDRWQHQLVDTGTTLFLCDRAGKIVSRRVSDGNVRNALDRVHAAEGFDYSEESVGTNGLGTSIVERAAVYIEGSQHYNDALAGLACAAAPVFAPIGEVLGSISLGGPIGVANPLMLSVTREIGQQIEERLRASARPQDLALAMSFMRFRNSRRPTVVVDQESLLANTPGLPYVNVHSHVTLWELLNSQDWTGNGVARLPFEDGQTDVMARRVVEGPRTHYVVHFAERDDIPEAAVRPVVRRHITVESATTPLAVGETGILVIDGPPGSGRATVAVSLLEQRGHRDDPTVITVSPAVETPWSTVDGLLARGEDVLLRHVDDLPDGEAATLRELITAHRTAVATGTRTSKLAMTGSSEAYSPALREAIGGLGSTVHTDALARTPERIPALVKRILERVDPARRHTISPAALQALVQWGWPGNIAELSATLTALVRDVPATVIQRKHLPLPLQQAPPRRNMTLMESAERDAIVRGLNAAHGNKSEAATLLGMGRTTLYRRLRQLGLDDDEGSL